MAYGTLGCHITAGRHFVNLTVGIAMMGWRACDLLESLAPGYNRVIRCAACHDEVGLPASTNDACTARVAGNAKSPRAWL